MAAYAIQFRRGTTTEHSSFTGLLGEVTVDTTKKTIVVHDGSTAGGSPLALEGAAVSSSTGAFSSNVTVGGTLGVTGLTTMSGGAAVTGDMTMTGHVLPSANITYDLGSTTKMWRDVYVGPGSLYINGKKVIEDDSGTISVTTDANEDLKFTTSGTGTLKLISGNGINFTGELGAVSGDLQIGDHLDMNSNLIKEVATPVSGTDAANKSYVDTAAASAVTGGSNAVSGTTGAFSSNLTVAGNLTVSGTTTTVNTTDVLFEDNMFVLNSNTTGTPTENSGFEVERGDSLNVQFLWNEADDRWSTGSNTLHAGALVANTFTGAVTGNVTGNIDGVVGGNTPAAGTFTALGGTTVTASNAFQGDLIGDVTGDISGSAGTVTSIAAHIKDEDDMASDSATHVPSQQSVKAYVTSQIATKDNTDEMTEGSTNLYFTNARARGAISVSGDISYNSSTGVISTTGLASSDTDDLSEGSSNLYFTNERVDDRVDALIVAGTNVQKVYDDAAGTYTLTATDTTYSIQDGELSQNNFTDADHSKLNAIEASADVTDTTNVEAAGALMRSGGAMTGAITTNSTFDGRDVATDGTKLDGIEANATADQTDAEIRAAVEAASDSNVFTDDDHSKLGGIEAGATADQTAAEIVALVEAGTDSNTFTDADHSKLDGIEASATADQTAAEILTLIKTVDGAGSGLDADTLDGNSSAYFTGYTDTAIANLSDSAPGTLDTLNELAAALGDDANFSATVTNSIATKMPLAGGAFTGAVTTTSTFDGRDVATDGTKLDGIEANATADQSAAEIRAKVEAATDSNVFTDADHTKLNGIEASADVTDTANVTSAGALMDSELTGIAHVKSLNQALTTTSSPTFTAVTATDFNGTATYAKYADLAERYAADAPYEEGTLVMFGGEAEVTSAQGYGSTKIAGVVSTKPAFAMNDAAGNSETHPFIALQGRVPCKVVGTVSKGDILVASDISGVATVWTETTVDPRMTAYVGIAIEDKTAGGEGYVEVKVGK